MESAMVQTDNNAMTEVALALAMAFFAIFILAAVSMSQPVNSDTSDRIQEKIVHDVILQLEAESENVGERALEQEETLLIYHQGAFLNEQLKPFLPDNNMNVSRRYVIAVSPNLSMAEMIQIKKNKNMPNLAITLLNDEWQQRLELLK